MSYIEDARLQEAKKADVILRNARAKKDQDDHDARRRVEQRRYLEENQLAQEEQDTSRPEHSKNQSMSKRQKQREQEAQSQRRHDKLRLEDTYEGPHIATSSDQTDQAPSSLGKAEEQGIEVQDGDTTSGPRIEERDTEPFATKSYDRGNQAAAEQDTTGRGEQAYESGNNRDTPGQSGMDNHAKPKKSRFMKRITRLFHRTRRSS